MFTTKETKTGTVQTSKLRNLLNEMFNDITQKTKRLKTSISNNDKEIMLTFTDGELLTTFHVQEIGNTPIPDAIQLSLPFAQEGGTR